MKESFFFSTAAENACSQSGSSGIVEMTLRHELLTSTCSIRCTKPFAYLSKMA
jgi:hypothetical protein